MTAKQVATKYFGASVFPSEITDKFLVHRKTTNPTDANIQIKSYRHFGYHVKSKTLSGIGRVTYIAVKAKEEVDRYNFNNR